MISLALENMQRPGPIINMTVQDVQNRTLVSEKYIVKVSIILELPGSLFLSNFHITKLGGQGARAFPFEIPKRVFKRDPPKTSRLRRSR